MSEAGIVLGDYEEESQQKKPKKASKAEKANKTLGNDNLKDMTADELKKLLDDTLKKEDYEKAAIIRDELNRRN